MLGFLPCQNPDSRPLTGMSVVPALSRRDRGVSRDGCGQSVLGEDVGNVCWDTSMEGNPPLTQQPLCAARDPDALWAWEVGGPPPLCLLLRAPGWLPVKPRVLLLPRAGPPER